MIKLMETKSNKIKHQEDQSKNCIKTYTKFFFHKLQRQVQTQHNILKLISKCKMSIYQKLSKRDTNVDLKRATKEEPDRQ